MNVRRPATLLAVFAIASLLTRASLLWVEIVNIDEAAHIVGSWELLRGRLLYTDYADHKPPLLYVYYAIPQLLFGRGMPAVRLFTVLATLPLTALAVSAFFRHDRRGVMAGALFLVYSAAFLGHDMLAVSADLVMLLPAAWAFVAVADEEHAARPGRWALAGFLLGLAVLVKYQAGLWIGALLAVALGASPRLRRLACCASLLGAFALPLLAAYALFAAAGGGAGFLYWNVTHNLRYTANPIDPIEALGRASANLLPFLLTTAALAWGTWRSRRLDPASHRTRLAAWLLVFALPMAVLGFRFYPHYFIPLDLALALCAAPWAADVSRTPLTPEAKTALALTLVVLVGFNAANVFLYAGTQVYEETRPVFRDVASRLRRDPCFPGGNLFVWGFAPSFYYFADLPVASRFVMPQASLTGYVPGNLGSLDTSGSRLVLAQHWDWLLKDLEANQPTYLLDTAPAGIHRWHHYPLTSFPRLLGFVRERYEVLEVVDGVVLYRRRGCEPSAAVR
jgi:4-amino-4-deoxy-L-arabinose transferase-like glycosyltransferase